MNELMMMRNLFSGMMDSNGIAWLRVAMLICLFGIFLFAPQRIKHPTIFRWACTLFALSIILPSFSQMAVGLWGEGLSMSRNMRMNMPEGSAWVIYLPQLVGPLLLGISIILAFVSLSPEPVAKSSSSQPARPHPLD